MVKPFREASGAGKRVPPNGLSGYGGLLYEHVQRHHSPGQSCGLQIIATFRFSRLANAKETMTDRISSSVSNVSMFPHTSEGLDMAPSKERNTTMLKLDCLPGRSAGLVDTYSEGFDEITDATSEGKALLDFFYSLEKEPGHDLTLWGRVEELEDQFLVFIGT